MGNVMDKEKSSAILPLIVAAVVDRISAAYRLDKNAAIEKLYSTQLYSHLENEKTKVWYYSADNLFNLYQKEIETGKLELPEY